MLEINNLHASVQGKEILKGLDLKVNQSEVHAIMGLNGYGQSTVASVFAGRERFEATDGEITYKRNELLEWDPEVRAREGIFLAFQYPVEIPGVSNISFLRTALNDIREHRNEPPLSGRDFLNRVKEMQELVEFDSSLTQRSLNEGFRS